MAFSRLLLVLTTISDSGYAYHRARNVQDAIVAMGSDINKAITNVSSLVLFAVVPFNILKGIVVSVLTLLLYKRVEKIFFQK